MDNLQQFHKYTAMGNDMLVIDPSQITFDLSPEAVRAICDRHFGIGADGICYGPLSAEQPFAMRFYNPDGTTAEKSGNGLRIFARYLCDASYVDTRNFQIGIHNENSDVTVMDDTFQSIRMTMGRASFITQEIPMSGDYPLAIGVPLQVEGEEFIITCANVGNPHCIIFDQKLSEESVKRYGSLIEHHERFPNRINVQFVKVIDKNTIQIEIWERGAGYTLASGTSSCATACAAIVNEKCQSPITVHMAGGNAVVEVDADWNIQLTGNVLAVGHGYFADDLISSLG